MVKTSPPFLFRVVSEMPVNSRLTSIGAGPTIGTRPISVYTSTFQEPAYGPVSRVHVIWVSVAEMSAHAAPPKMTFKSVIGRSTPVTTTFRPETD